MDKRISNRSQASYIRRYTLNGGREDGLKVIEIDNGVLRLTLNESKALDMMQLWHNGINVSFVSKNGFTKREIPFSKRFEGGMLYTVGLDSAGGREGYEVHGSFHNIPASVIQTLIDDEKIEVTAEIFDTELFSKSLRIIRTIRTKVLSDEVEIYDTLINDGTRDENYTLLYHVNVGYPMLDEGVKIEYDPKTVIPRTPLAEERINEIHDFLSPVDNEEERCYFIENKSPIVKVLNKKINKELTLEYSDSSLSKMVLWQSNASHDYALGIEPTTTFLDDLFEYKVIKPQEKKNFNIKLKLR